MEDSPSILERYLHTLTHQRSPATIRVARRDLSQFAAWWEQAHQRPFDPALLRDADLRAWKHARQVVYQFQTESVHASTKDERRKTDGCLRPSSSVLRRMHLLPSEMIVDGMAPATINRAIAALRGFGSWLVTQGIVSEHPASDLKDLPVDPPAPRSIPTEAIDALLRAVRAERDERLRLRDEALWRCWSMRACGCRKPVMCSSAISISMAVQ